MTTSRKRNRSSALGVQHQINKRKKINEEEDNQIVPTIDAKIQDNEVGTSQEENFPDHNVPDDYDLMEQENEFQEPVKTIAERMDQLFTWLNEEEIAAQYLALAELSRGCKHALRSKESYDNPEGEDKAETRQKIQQQSILFRYLSLSPSCAELMRIWDTQFKEHNRRMCAKIMEILAMILDANYFLNSRKSSASVARTVVKDKLRWIYAGFSGAFSTSGGGFSGGYDTVALCRSALHLLSSCARSSGSIALYLIQHFNFAYKPFTLLANRRGKPTENGENRSEAYKKDIRTQYISFVLSFLQHGDVSMIQSAMQVRFILPAIFHELANDAPELIIEFVLAMENSILLNPAISRKAKSAFFSGFFLDQMATIYKTRVRDSAELEEILDRFLFTLCCSPTCGIVYSDPDWFVGRSIDSKHRNKALLRFISALKPSSHVKQQKLALDVLRVAPDIIEPFLQHIVLSYEPRLSSKWLENISFLAKIISLPSPPFTPPETGNMLNNLTTTNQNIRQTSEEIIPNRSEVVLTNLIPSVLSRTILSQGLQNDSKLVKFQSIIILLVIFQKLEFVVAQCKEKIQNSSRKQEWKRYMDLLLHDIRKNLPDIQVILALHQQTSSEFAQELSDAEAPTELLYERTLCLLNYYHRSFPGILSGANFDILKLITSDFNKLPLAIQSHIISLLANPNLKWTNQVHGANISYFGVLLESFVSASPALKNILSPLLYELLTSMEFFSGTKEAQKTELEAFFVPLTKTSVSILDRILSDCVRRRYELVDTRTKILRELSSYPGNEDADISLLACSAIRWYYKTNAPSTEEATNAQYYLSAVCLQLINQLVISPLSLAVMLHVIESSISSPSDMEIEATTTTVTTGNQKFLLKAKENDVLFSYMLSYIINQFDKTSKRNSATASKATKEFWSVELETPKTLQSLASVKKSLSKLQQGNMSAHIIRNEVQNIAAEERLVAILSLSSLIASEDLESYFRTFDVDFSVLPGLKKLAKNSKWAAARRVLPISVLLSAHKEISSKELSEAFSSITNVSLSSKIIKQLILLIQNEISAPKSSNDDHSSRSTLFLSFLENILPNSIHTSTSKLIISHFYSNQHSRSVFFPDSSTVSPLAIPMLRLCQSITKKLVNDNPTLTELRNSWGEILDFYGFRLVCFLKDNTSNDSNYISNILDVLRECYSLCSTKIIHKMISQLLNVLHSDPVHSQEYRELCYHLIERETNSQSVLVNKLMTSLFLLPSELKVEAKNDSQSHFLPKQTFHQLIKLCENDKHSAESILLRVLLLLLSPPQIARGSHDTTDNDNAQSLDDIQTFGDTKLFTKWIQKLTTTRSSLLAILVAINANFRSVFNTYVLKMKPLVGVASVDMFWKQEAKLRLFYSVIRACAANSLILDVSVVSAIDKHVHELLIHVMQSTADLESSDSPESRKLFESSELIAAPLASLLFDLRSKLQLIKPIEIETDIKKLLSQRKGPFAPNAVSLISEMISTLVNINETTTSQYTSKFAFYCMTCVQSLLAQPEQQTDRVFAFLDILESRLDWCILSDDESMATRSRTVFLGFARALFKFSFNSAQVLRIIRLILTQLASKYSTTDDTNIPTQPEEFTKLVSTIHGMVTGHSAFLPLLFEENEIIEAKTNRYELVSLIAKILEFISFKEFEKKQLKIYACAYGATLHPVDQKIAWIISRFEEAGISMCSIGFAWGDSQRRLISSHEAIQLHTIAQMVTEGELIQYRRLLNSSLAFVCPSEEISLSECSVDPDNYDNYDPRFLLPFLAHAIEFFDLDCRRMIDSGIISFTLVCISSKYPKIREWSYFILSRFYDKVKDTRFPEKLQVNVLLQLLRNSLVQTNQCISAAVGVFFCKALIILLHPDHYLYRNLNKFLLHRPVISLDDIPMFFDLMYSSSAENHYQKRNWELDTLLQSLHRFRDYKLFKGRNVMGILMSVYDGVSVDSHMRSNILAVLRKACAIPRVSVDLIENHSVISWLQFQVNISSGEVFGIITKLLESVPHDYLLDLKNLCLPQIFDVFVLFANRCSNVGDLKAFFDCLSVFLKLTESDEDVKKNFRFSDSLLLSLSSLVQTCGDYCQEFAMIMMRVIVRMHWPENLSFNELASGELCKHVFYYQRFVLQGLNNSDTIHSIPLHENRVWFSHLATFDSLGNLNNSATLCWLSQIDYLVSILQ